MKKIIFSVFLVFLCLSVGCDYSKGEKQSQKEKIESAKSEVSYLACKGFSGTAAYQSSLPLESRTISANESPIMGSIAITNGKLSIEGIPLMTSTYDICIKTDQSLIFASACDPANPDQFHDSGVLNKVTGNVRYHVGDVLFILSCKKVDKVVN